MPIDRAERRFGAAEGGEVVFEAAPFVLDLLDGANAELAEDGNGRAPTLEGMLKEKRLDHEWQ